MVCSGFQIDYILVFVGNKATQNKAKVFISRNTKIGQQTQMQFSYRKKRLYLKKKPLLQCPINMLQKALPLGHYIEFELMNHSLSLLGMERDDLKMPKFLSILLKNED